MWLSLIATGDPCDQAETEGVAEEQISADTIQKRNLLEEKVNIIF